MNFLDTLFSSFQFYREMRGGNWKLIFSKPVFCEAWFRNVEVQEWEKLLKEENYS
jgi:hypothetical protein